MNVIKELSITGYEKVLACTNPSVGLNAIIAIHNTRRGPACGGVRMLPYPSEQEALEDVLRLSKGMSYKSSLANIGFGGGKSVILLDPKMKTPALFHAFGEFVDSLKGKYIAAKDMNIESQDLLEIKKKTQHVLGIEGVSGSSGDPSPITARGLFAAMRATLEKIIGKSTFKGVKVAFQGIGHVGYEAAKCVRENGGEIIVTDTNQAVLKKAELELNAKVVSLESIYDVECDIFSPCARGAILNSETIPRLQCRAIVGAANNQLLTPEDGIHLFQKGIFYAPDYLVNAGGIINIFVERIGDYDVKKANQMADNIYTTLKEIIERSKIGHKAPFLVADQIAEERMR